MSTRRTNKESNPVGILRILLRPIARLAIRRGFKFQEFVEAGKWAMIDAARAELEAHGNNQSRLSLLTGLHRYDVKRLLEAAAPTPDGGSGETKSLLARVVSTWKSDRRYQTPTGKPRSLSVDGKDSEFAELVEGITRAVNPYTVLFELERLQLVARTESGLTLLSTMVADRRDDEAGLSILAADAADLHEAVWQNIAHKDAPAQLHVRTEFDNIPLSALDSARQWVLKVGTEFHQRVHDYLAALDRDTGGKEPPPGDGKQARARVAVTTVGLGVVVAEAEKTDPR